MQGEEKLESAPSSDVSQKRRGSSAGLTKGPEASFCFKGRPPRRIVTPVSGRFRPTVLLNKKGYRILAPFQRIIKTYFYPDEERNNRRLFESNGCSFLISNRYFNGLILFDLYLQ